MARKASDLFTLLQSRGGGRGASGRSGPGLFGSMMGWFSSLGGPKRRRFDGGGRGRMVQFSSLALAGIVFASVGVGYLLGDAFPMGGKNSPLRSQGRQEPQGTVPQVLGNPAVNLDKYRLSPDKEADVLSKQCFALAMYEEGDRDREQAADLALQLRAHGIATARPFLLWNPRHWLTVAYYEDAEQAQAVREKLLQVPELAAHPQFGAIRKKTPDWPKPMRVP
jgi:hypothetical protein